MVWVFLIGVTILLVVGLGSLVVGRASVDPVPPPVSTTPSTGLGAEVHSADIHDIRFDTALRGYRMDQVDDVLDTLHALIAELEAQQPVTPAGEAAPPSTPTASPPTTARPTTAPSTTEPSTTQEPA